MLIACVQTDVSFANVDENIHRVSQWLEQAASSNAEFVVFPECMLSGYAFDSRDEALPHALTTEDER